MHVSDSAYLMEVKALQKVFHTRKGMEHKAVNHVSLGIRKGETFGLVGESGCGKSTLGRMIAGLLQPTSGTILFDGENILTLLLQHELAFRKQVQMVFQDPYASLNPRMTIGEIVGEGIDIHHLYQGTDRNKLIEHLLHEVGLPVSYIQRYSFELSGGQRQRVGIARALSVEPTCIILDEPVSALDVSVQAQILNLLLRLKRERNLTYLFISHDLSVVRSISDQIGVMYNGRLVEVSPAGALFDNPLHPYTNHLINNIPIPTWNQRNQFSNPYPPSSIQINYTSNGCSYSSKCPLTSKKCHQTIPRLEEKQTSHYVACHFV